ncbi:MAG: MBL fold metallo-hydrolase [Cocleimonas sp.]
MHIKFYGVRGSIATPGADTVKYGGNTACVLVESDNGTLFILDAGTGIKKLGDDLIKRSNLSNINLMFSHLHWDHIQGFPFFAPIHRKNQKVHLMSAHLDEEKLQSVLAQMTDPHFPVPSDQLEAEVEVTPNIPEVLEIEDVTISTLALNHSGGGSAYKFQSTKGSLVYATDNELFPPSETRTSYTEWLEFVKGVDYLIHDAMYLETELEKIHGWGHSLISQTLKLAGEAGVANVILFHHDPARTDKQLDEIKQNSREWMAKNYPECGVYLAKEGDQYDIV